MAVTIPNLTDEQRQELNDICANEELMEFMEAGLPNHGEVEDDEVILARQQQAIAAFSEMPDSFWSFK